MSDFSNKIIVGLTGMSGAGKTTAAELFSDNGFEIIDCDEICREIVEKDKPCLKEISEAFGAKILSESGELDRKAMADKIFSAPQMRLKLNSIMYPYVTYIVIKAIEVSVKKYVLIDAPTLFESGIDDICRFKVSVVSDRETLIERLMKRDSISEMAASMRLSSQFEKNYYIEKSDFYAENSGKIFEFKDSVERIISNIRSFNDEK